VITSARVGAEGVTLTWIDGSANERGFVIRGPGAIVVVPAGTTSAIFPLRQEGDEVTVTAWNEAGFSAASTVHVLPPHRVAGRR
jgi:hypothetical protein